MKACAVCLNAIPPQNSDVLPKYAINVEVKGRDLKFLCKKLKVDSSAFESNEDGEFPFRFCMHCKGLYGEISNIRQMLEKLRNQLEDVTNQLKDKIIKSHRQNQRGQINPLPHELKSTSVFNCLLLRDQVIQDYEEKIPDGFEDSWTSLDDEHEEDARAFVESSYAPEEDNQMDGHQFVEIKPEPQSDFEDEEIDEFILPEHMIQSSHEINSEQQEAQNANLEQLRAETQDNLPLIKRRKLKNRIKAKSPRILGPGSSSSSSSGSESEDSNFSASDFDYSDESDGEGSSAASTSGRKRVGRPRTPKENLTCFKCNRVFKSASNLRRHVRAIHEKPPMKCEICDKPVDLNSALPHMRIHEAKSSEEEKTLQCPQCPKKYATEFMLKRHKNFHNFSNSQVNTPNKIKPKHICDMENCAEEFETASLLKNHRKKIHGEKTPSKKPCIICSSCGMQYSDRLSFLQHERRTHPELFVHACAICNKTYAEPSHLETHLKTHVKPEADSTNYDYNCCVCAKEFHTPQHLAAHLMNHSGESKTKRFACNLCPNLFCDQRTMENHVRRVHEGKSKQTCPICGRVYMKPLRFKRHVEKHKTDGERLKCELCDKSYTKKSTLTKHIKFVHQGIKPASRMIICEICGKTFKNKCLVIHMKRKHRNTSKWNCYFCAKGYNETWMLAEHMRNHTKERPYICQICHKDFTQNHCLTNHVKVHRPRPVNYTENNLTINHNQQNSHHSHSHSVRALIPPLPQLPMQLQQQGNYNAQHSALSALQMVSEVLWTWDDFNIDPYGNQIHPQQNLH